MMAGVTRQMRMLYAMCALALVEHRADLDGSDEAGFDIDLPVFSVGLAAQLADIHPQTLRQYDRHQLIVPQRTEGGARRYSLRDIDRLVQAQHLSQDEGINLSGISRILNLEEENRQLRREVKRLKEKGRPSVFAADKDGDITEVQRSQQARHWRHDMHHTVRELPARHYYSADGTDGNFSSVGPGSNTAPNAGIGATGHRTHDDANDAEGSLVERQALTLWNDFLD